MALTAQGLVVVGGLEAGSLPRFAVTLAAAVLLARDGRVTLRLDSPGGNLAVAHRMAAWVGLAGRIVPVDTEVMAGAACQSSCAVVFAAGAERRAAPSALFMFHAPRFTGDRRDPIAALRREEAAEAHYLAALAAADPGLVRRLKERGVFDGAAPGFLRGRELSAPAGSFVTALLSATPAKAGTTAPTPQGVTSGPAGARAIGLERFPSEWNRQEVLPRGGM
jgi:hypothetical protein